jgi:hypothetical protein
LDNCTGIREAVARCCIHSANQVVSKNLSHSRRSGAPWALTQRLCGINGADSKSLAERCSRLLISFGSSNRITSLLFIVYGGEWAEKRTCVN